MAEKLTFATGVKEYELNDAVTVRFNPTDSDFVERMYDAFTDLDSKQDQFEKEVKEAQESGEKEMFSYSRSRDKEMRETIDSLLGEGVSDAVFADDDGKPFNCYALADGLPVWMNLMFAIAETIESSFTAEQKRSDPRLKKFSGKYDQMTKKYAKGKKK